mmetsp:Transcript_4257/g.6485  ORF Transcript_4257/g.6485 Transcript_4257/m.6485 type:complete len:119 (-) Transcript_4257:126-482(-)
MSKRGVSTISQMYSKGSTCSRKYPRTKSYGKVSNNNNSNNNQIQEKRKHDKYLHRRVKAIGIESSASELHLVHISSTRNTSCSQLNMNMHERPCLTERSLQYLSKFAGRIQSIPPRSV